jgi:hypothetical protein
MLARALSTTVISMLLNACRATGLMSLSLAALAVTVLVSCAPKGLLPSAPNGSKGSPDSGQEETTPAPEPTPVPGTIPTPAPMMTPTPVAMPIPTPQPGPIAVVSIPSNTWINVAPNYEGAPFGGFLAPFSFNQMGVYDPITRRTINYESWGDDVHGLYIYANAIVAYDPPLNKVSVIKISNWKDRSIPLPENLTEPTPVDRHPCGGVGLDPESNSVYIVNGANQAARQVANYPDHPNDTWKLNLQSRVWTKVSDFTTGSVHPPTDVGNYGGLVYNPKVKKFVYLTMGSDGAHTWLLDPVSNIWSQLPVDASAKFTYGPVVETGPAVASSGIAYDSKRDLIVAFGGGYNTNSSGIDMMFTKTLWSYSLSQNKWTRLADAPLAGEAPEFAYDSKNDIFLGVVGQKTFIYHPQTNTWTQSPALLQRGRILQRQNVTYNPAYDLFVFQGGPWEAPVWALYRYGGGN